MNITINGNKFIATKDNGQRVRGEISEELCIALSLIVESQISEIETAIEIATQNATEEQAVILKSFYPFWGGG